MFNQALARDGFQCMITGLFDGDSCCNCPELKAVAYQYDVPAFDIKTAHIVNKSTMQLIDPNGISEYSVVINVRFNPWVPCLPLYSSVIQTDDDIDAVLILESFGFSNFAEALKEPGGIHQTWNLLSLEHNLYQKFDALEMWLESTQQVCHSQACQSPN